MNEDTQVEFLKQLYPEGTRIQLDLMGDDPDPIRPGTCGTVLLVDDIGTVHCRFDDGRRMGVIPGVDAFHVIERETEGKEER